MAADQPQRRPERPHPALLAAILGGGLLLGVMIVLLTLMLAELDTSRQHIESQDAKLTRLEQASQPLLEQSTAVVERAQPLIDDIEPLLERSGPLARETLSILEPLSPAAGALSESVRRLPALEASGLRLASVATAVFEQIEVSDLMFSAAVVRDLALDLSADRRLVSLIDEGRDVLAEIRARGLLRKASASSRRARVALAVLRKTLRVQRRALRVQRRTKAIQATALVHIKSIDRKTGGTFPPSPDAP